MILPYLSDYLKYLAEHNYNKVTIHSYNFGLKNFNEYLDSNNINFSLMTINDIDGFMEYLKSKKAKSTINVIIACLRNYLNFLKKYKKTTVMVEVTDIKRIREDRKITKNEIDNKDVLQKLNFIDSKRDKLIIQLMLKTGIRISELVRIRKIDVLKNKIQIGELEYILDNELNRLLNDFAINNPNKKSEYLFTAKNFKKYPNVNNLTVGSLERIIKKYFSDYSYQDLKLIYYKSLCEKLPNIIKIYKHKICNKIKLENIDKIV